MLELTFDNITQPIEEWALDYGIPSKLIRARLKDGWSVERAITEPMHVRKGWRFTDQKDKRRLITFNGESLTADQWGHRIGMSGSVVRVRLAKGWPLERALTEARKPGELGKAPKLITFNGESLTIKQWAERVGIDGDTLRNRLKNPKWTLARALSSPNAGTGSGKARRPKLITFNGETLAPGAWAERLGIDATTLQHRLTTLGWPLERALTEQHTGRGRGHGPRTGGWV